MNMRDKELICDQTGERGSAVQSLRRYVEPLLTKKGDATNITAGLLGEFSVPRENRDLT